MKPLWYVEKDAFGWTIYCRFMLGNQRAGVAHNITPGQYANAVDKDYLLSDVIQHLNFRRDNFIAEACHA